jgi:hypothetical protein
LVTGIERSDKICLGYEESPRTSISDSGCSTPDSYLNLLIEAYYRTVEPKTPDPFPQELMQPDRPGLDSPTRSAPVSHTDQLSKEQSPLRGYSTQVEDEKDEANSSSPPPYLLHEFPLVVTRGQVEYCQHSEFEAREVSCVPDALPRVTEREVDPSDSDQDESSSTDPDFQDLEQRQIKSREDSQFDPYEYSFGQGTFPTVIMNNVDLSDDHGSLNVDQGSKDVGLGRIESHKAHPESSWVRDTLLRVPNREEPLEKSLNFDPEFHLRGGDRSQRYQKLMTRPKSLQHSNESIAKSIELTVAKMTKNFHMDTSSEDSLKSTSTMVGSDEDTKNFHKVTSSEESLESTTTVMSSDGDTKNFHMVTSSEDSWGKVSTMMSSDEYSFVMDQMEVWDSIIMGSRTLQQVYLSKTGQRLTCVWLNLERQNLFSL